MRILLTTRSYLNGQTTHVLSLARELVRQGHAVFLLITHLDHLMFGPYLEQAPFPYATSANLGRLLPLFARWRPQIIHNHSAHTLGLALNLGQALEVPTLSTIHSLDFELVNLLENQEAVIFISEEMAKHFSGLAVLSHVIENGVDLPRSNPHPQAWNRQALILAQVSANKEKNFRSMTESLLTWGWNVKSAGNWRYPGVSYLGWVHDVEPLFAQTNLVIGTGRTIREGMAAGSAAWVLGEYSDGLVTPSKVEDLVKTNFSGRRSKAPFAPETAAAWLRDPLPEYFRELAEFGPPYAREHFSIEAMVHKVLALYQRLLAHGAKTDKNRKIVIHV